MTQTDLREAVRDGAAMMLAYLLACLLLLSLVLVFQSGSDFPVSWLRGAVLAGALGLRGQLVARYDGSGDGAGEGFFQGASFSYGTTPLVLFALAALLTLRIGSRAEQARPTETARVALVRAVLAAGAATVVLLVLAVVSRIPGDVLDDTDSSASLGVGYGSVLLWSFPLLFLGFAGGRLRQRARLHGASLRSVIADRTAGVLGWFTTTALHAAVSSAGLLVGGFVYLMASTRHEVRDSTDTFTSDDASGVVLFLYALPNLLLGATGFFQGFSFGFGGSFGDVGGSTSAGLLTGDVPAQHYLWALIVLASAVVVGTRRALQTPDRTVQQEWWRAGLGSLAFWGLAALLVHVHLGGGPISAGYGWTPLTLVPLAFGWGVLMAFVGRRLLPTVQASLPTWAARVKVVETAPPVAAPEAEDEAAAEPALAAGTDVLSSSTTTLPVAVPAEPLSRRTVAIALSVIAVLVVGVIGYKVADAHLYSPDSTVKGYFDDLAAGRVSSALDRMTDPPTDRTLLTDAALPASARLSSPHVERIRRQGKQAFAEVTYLVGTQTQHDSVRLVQSGSAGGVFHGWKVAQQLGTISLDGSGQDSLDLTLNGIAVTTDDEHPALPGVYTIGLKSDLLQVRDDRVVMTFSDKQEYVETELSDDAQTRAQAAVATYLKDCLARAKDLDPPCGFHVYAYGDRYERVRWTLTGEPTLDFRYSDGVVDVSSSSSATAHVTGTAVSSGFFGSPDTRTPIDEDVSAYVYGTVRFSGGSATFDPE